VYELERPDPRFDHETPFGLSTLSLQRVKETNLSKKNIRLRASVRVLVRLARCTL
jgi:hypothetical protein